MKIIKSYREAAATLMGGCCEFAKLENLREIAEHKDEIVDLVERKHLFELKGGIYVAQQYNELTWAWDLRDFYLECDTDSQVMTQGELGEFASLSGEVRP